jgi:hypothetical protein
VSSILRFSGKMPPYCRAGKRRPRALDRLTELLARTVNILLSWINESRKK